MRRIVTSLSVQERLVSASEFVREHAGQEILLLSQTRNAADEFVRAICKETDGVFGVHRFTLPQLAFTLAAEPLAAEGKTFISGVALEAMAARAVHACRTNGALGWFDPVATTPGFFRALASTINELRLNNIHDNALRAAGPSGLDLAEILKHFEKSLQEAGLADLAIAYQTAMAIIGGSTFRFRKCPLVLLDLIPTTLLEQEVIQALGKASTSVLATAHDRDLSSVAILREALDASHDRLVLRSMATPLTAYDSTSSNRRLHLDKSTPVSRSCRQPTQVGNARRSHAPYWHSPNPECDSIRWPSCFETRRCINPQFRILSAGRKCRHSSRWAPADPIPLVGHFWRCSPALRRV